MKSFRSLIITGQRGVLIIEYAIMCAVMTIACLVTMHVMGDDITGDLHIVSDSGGCAGDGCAPTVHSQDNDNIP